MHLQNYSLSLFVDGCDLEVHGVRGGEDVGGALHHRLARLGHGDGRAPRDEDRLVPGTQRQDPREPTLDQHHLHSCCSLLWSRFVKPNDGNGQTAPKSCGLKPTCRRRSIGPLSSNFAVV